MHAECCLLPSGWQHVVAAPYTLTAADTETAAAVVQ